MSLFESPKKSGKSMKNPNKAVLPPDAEKSELMGAAKSHNKKKTDRPSKLSQEEMKAANKRKMDR